MPKFMGAIDREIHSVVIGPNSSWVARDLSQLEGFHPSTACRFCRPTNLSGTNLLCLSNFNTHSPRNVLACYGRPFAELRSLPCQGAAFGWHATQEHGCPKMIMQTSTCRQSWQVSTSDPSASSSVESCQFEKPTTEATAHAACPSRTSCS